MNVFSRLVGAEIVEVEQQLTHLLADHRYWHLAAVVLFMEDKQMAEQACCQLTAPSYSPVLW
jgi:hypothetical protein